MTDIIKAEWLRLRKSNHFPFYSLIIWIAIAVFPLATLLGGDNINISSYLVSVYDVDSIFIPFFIGAFISVCITLNYLNKTAYYEIMSGKSSNAIFISRIIVYTTYMTVGLFVFMGVVMAAIGVSNGIGEMDNIPVRLLLFAVVIIHICIASVLISMAGHSLLSPILILLRFEVFEGIITMIIPRFITDIFNYSQDKITNFCNYFVSSQIRSIFSADINSDLVIAVIISLVFETVLWYIVAAVSFKRKNF